MPSAKRSCWVGVGLGVHFGFRFIFRSKITCLSRLPICDLRTCPNLSCCAVAVGGREHVSSQASTFQTEWVDLRASLLLWDHFCNLSPVLFGCLARARACVCGCGGGVTSLFRTCANKTKGVLHFPLLLRIVSVQSAPEPHERRRRRQI